MHLNLLDFAVIALYMGGLLAIGFYFSKRHLSKESYFLGNRRMPWFLVGISVVATLVSTNTYLATPGEMIKYGIGFFLINLSYIFVIPVVNRIIIPSLMRLPVTSVYEYIERRFSLAARSVAAGVFIFTRLIWMGLIMYTVSFAVSKMTGWSIPGIVLAIGIATTIYTTLGGMPAVIWTDFAQFVLLFGGAAFIPFYVGLQTGAGPALWWDVFSQAGRVSVPVFSWDPAARITIVGIVLSGFLWHICTHGADQIAAQRYLTTSSIRSARRSVWIFSIFNVALSGLLLFCGVSLFFFQFRHSKLPLQEFQSQIASHADGVLPEFIATQLPAGFSGLLLAALLAAAMSSLSSGINSISTVVLSDFLQRFGLVKTEPENLKPARRFSVLAGLGGMTAALLVYEVMHTSGWNLIDLMERVNHLFVAPLGALFLSGILFRRAGSEAALLGFLAGVLTSFLIAFSREVFGLQQSISFMWIMPASFVVSLAVSFLAAYWFKPPSESQVIAMSRLSVSPHPTPPSIVGTKARVNAHFS